MEPARSDIAPHMPLLQQIAATKATILELGCEWGNGSTRAFSQGLALSPSLSKLMVSVDIKPENPAEVPPYPFWVKVTGDSLNQNTVRLVQGLSPTYDLIFIDTIHDYDHIQAELRLWYPLSRVDTEWLFHDTWMEGRYNHMTDAIKEFALSHRMTYRDLSQTSHGLGWMGA